MLPPGVSSTATVMEVVLIIMGFLIGWWWQRTSNEYTWARTWKTRAFDAPSREGKCAMAALADMKIIV